MGYLVFCYLVIGFYLIVFMLGTSYDMLRNEPLFNNIFFIVVIWILWPFVLYKFRKL